VEFPALKYLFLPSELRSWARLGVCIGQVVHASYRELLQLPAGSRGDIPLPGTPARMPRRRQASGWRLRGNHCFLWASGCRLLGHQQRTARLRGMPQAAQPRRAAGRFGGPLMPPPPSHPAEACRWPFRRAAHAPPRPTQPRLT
jgi:hypothetical protein